MQKLLGAVIRASLTGQRSSTVHARSVAGVCVRMLELGCKS